MNAVPTFSYGYHMPLGSARLANGSTICRSLLVGPTEVPPQVKDRLVKENRMNNQTVAAVLFIVALALLGLYLLRRRQRKDSSK
jgi:LPXTG-motif cell wall-anchored protein